MRKNEESFLNNDLIEKCITPTIKDFNENYLLKHRPVIISGSLNWPALSKWNADYLKKVYPDKAVELTIFRPDITEMDKESDDIVLTFPAAIDLIYNNTDQKKKHYLMQSSILQNFAELDIDIPPYAKKSNIFDKNLWIGESGVNTRPHYDYSNNFLTQIVGRKRVKLYSPADSINMYSYSIKDDVLKNNSAVHISRIADSDYLNHKLYPNFKLVKCLEEILYPGDILFIPNGWWHEIKSLDTSISINFWWKSDMYSLSNSQLTDIICSTFYWHKDTFDKKIHEHFDLSKFKDDLEISKFALAQELLCVSAIFLLSYINDNIHISNEKVIKWKKYLNEALEEKDYLLNNQEIVSIIKDIGVYR